MAEQEEIKIPVFSVLKNGIILKNIFLNNPQWESKPSSDFSSQEQEENDDFLVIGRHPDCHIVLDHPSISRFHLEIRAKPTSRKLSVMDLASVHGTWVSGNKIQPNIPIDLTEGDTVKLGASTRVYKLRWIPLTSAFQMEKPLPSLLEENEEIHQLENLNEAWVEEIPSAPPIPESYCLTLESDKQSPAVKALGEKSPSFYSVVPMSESIGSSMLMTPEKNGNANEGQSDREYMSPLASGKKSKSLSLLSRRIKSESVSSLRIQTERNRKNMSERSCIKELAFENQENDATLEECKREETLFRVLFNEEEETFVSAKENVTPLSSMNQKSYTRIQEALPNAYAILTMREEHVHLDKETWTPEALRSRKQNRPILTDCVKKEGDEAHASDENFAQVVTSQPMLRKSLEELQISSLNSITSLSEEEEAFYSDKENWTPEVRRKLKSNLQLDGEEEKENMTLEVSGIKKSKEPVQIDLERSDGEEETFPSDKENMTPQVSGAKKSKKKLQRNLLWLDAENEAFASDKENITPNVLGVKKSKRELTGSQSRIEREIMERRKERAPFQFLFERSPSKNGSPLNNAQRIVDKERTPFKSLIEKSPSKNHSPLSDAQRIESKEKVQFLWENSPSKNNSPLNHVQKTADKKKVPFQSLQSSPLRNSSPVSDAQRTVDTGNKYSPFIPNQRTEEEFSNSFSHSSDKVLHKAAGDKKKWTMVVDTGCFLNAESRKALQLLEGLKGTQLIIPRIVIRELDCLKRRESLFRKNTKAASSVLQWVEECMVRSNWWIHVQSSLETMPVASTPPATPRSELGDGSDQMGTGASNSMAFSTCGSLMEIVSPTAEDHILDCALLFKRTKDDGQLVLLTDSVTLKIKAMAEGLLCEKPIEFRESLVNPYSKRFLWSDSSPRGSTWSSLNETGLMENYYYYQLPNVRKTAKETESVRGLKLILLHNSHYGMTSSVS